MYIRPISSSVIRPIALNTGSMDQGGSLGSVSFSDVLEKASQALDSLDREQMQSQIDLVTGNARDMHTAAIAAEKATLALDLVVSVRNRALEAYQEIMRMPV